MPLHLVVTQSCAAAGCTIIERLTPEFLATVKAKGDYANTP